jgi:hypothetical protein
MRIVSIFILTIALLSSCNKKQTSNFEYVEYSSIGNFQVLYSLKILPDGKSNIYTYNIFKNKKSYYLVTLDKMEMDSISELSKLILNAKIDQFNEFSCDQCLRLCLIIKTKNQKFKTFYHGQFYKDQNLQMLDRFSVLMDKIANRYIRTVDTAFVFESLSEGLLPPPPQGESNTERILKYLPNR